MDLKVLNLSFLACHTSNKAFNNYREHSQNFSYEHSSFSQPGCSCEWIIGVFMRLELVKLDI